MLLCIDAVGLNRVRIRLAYKLSTEYRYFPKYRSSEHEATDSIFSGLMANGIAVQH